MKRKPPLTKEMVDKAANADRYEMLGEEALNSAVSAMSAEYYFEKARSIRQEIADWRQIVATT